MPRRATMTLRRPPRADTAAVTACVCARLPAVDPDVGRQPGPMLADYATVIAHHEVHVAERDGAVVGVLVLDIEREPRVHRQRLRRPALQRTGWAA